MIVFEPFYENYGPDAILCGARPVFVPLPAGSSARPRPGRARLRPEDPRDHREHAEQPDAAGSSRASELEAIAALCLKHDAYAITDEIYEHILYDGRARADGDAPRACASAPSRSAASRRPSAVTGWRIG